MAMLLQTAVMFSTPEALPGMLSCAILGGERLEAFCTLEEELTIPLQRVLGW